MFMFAGTTHPRAGEEKRGGHEGARANGGG